FRIPRRPAPPPGRTGRGSCRTPRGTYVKRSYATTPPVSPLFRRERAAPPPPSPLPGGGRAPDNRREVSMKILFVPNLIVSSLTDKERVNILEAAGPGARIVEVKGNEAQRRELPDTAIIFGRGHAANFHLAKQIVYYHSIG